MKVSRNQLILAFIIGFLPVSLSARENGLKYKLLQAHKPNQPVQRWLLHGYSAKQRLIEVQDDQLIWISPTTGSQIGSLTLPEGYLHTITSKGGNYFAVTHLSNNGQENNKAFKVEVFAANGQKQYQVEKQQYYDDSMPLVAISDSDGALLLGKNSIGKIWFYDETGQLLREVELFPNAAYDLERTLSVDMSADGSRVGIAASRRGASPVGSDAPNPSAEPRVFVYGNDGTLLWQRDMPGFSTSVVAMSPDGDYLVANNYTADVQGNVKKQATLFDRQGRRIKDFDILFKKAAFSPDSKFVLLSDNMTAKLIDLSTEREVWNHQIRRQEGMIATAALSNLAEVAALLVAPNNFVDGHFLVTEPTIKIFDHSGQLIQEIRNADETFQTPALEISPDHQSLTIGFQDAYQIYEAVK